MQMAFDIHFDRVIRLTPDQVEVSRREMCKWSDLFMQQLMLPYGWLEAKGIELAYGVSYSGKSRVCLKARFYERFVLIC